jgi:hypothetical protein
MLRVTHTTTHVGAEQRLNVSIEERDVHIAVVPCDRTERRRERQH